MTAPITNRRVVVVYWKHQPESPLEVFSNLKNFCLSYPQYNYNTLNNYLSKGKIPYENDLVRIERKSILTGPAPAYRRQMIPVVRRVALQEGDDGFNDRSYWLSQPAAKRIEAVTAIVVQSLKAGEVTDKSMVKRKRLGT